MAEPHELRSYDYVNHSYAVVRDALRADLPGILGRATQGAAGRAETLAANLKVEIGALEVGVNIAIVVISFEEREDATQVSHPRATLVKLRWQAARTAALFPSMEAELWVYPLSKDETQLELRGAYTPPLGALGSALDSLVGHRLADASIHRFVSDIATLLKAELP